MNTLTHSCIVNHALLQFTAGVQRLLMDALNEEGPQEPGMVGSQQLTDLFSSVCSS